MLWSWVFWCAQNKDNGSLRITIVEHPLPLTWSGGIYLIKLVCFVLTLSERHFNSATHEEKLRGLDVDYWHECMLNGFSHWSNCLCFAGLLWWGFMYAALIQCMIDAACQDAIMTVSLFQHCFGATWWYWPHLMETSFKDIFMMCIYWVLLFISAHNGL